MKTSLNERFVRLLSYDGKTQKSFAEKVGVHRATINNIIARSKEPDFKTLNKIALAYPEINIRWLIVGDEPMILNTKDIEEISKDVSMVKENAEIYRTKVEKLIEDKEKLMLRVMELQDELLNCRTKTKQAC